MFKYSKLVTKIALCSFFVFLLATGCETPGGGDSDGKYAYESVEGDPLNTRIYTLDNGLKVYLSVYKDEPRVQTAIAVRTGSRNDPAETTGLAHYLEHMLFKGTHTMGTSDWESEKVVLDAISNLYEEHRSTDVPEEKKAIYAKIDSLSFEASKFAIANEYDKMISSIGARGTNAFTSNDMTVYINDIPSNEFDKWAMVEGERFRTLVLRLFHTELETVYEEFNRSQDRDGRWSYEKVMKGLLPTHPYGTQSTIGLGEHLKNPSMVNIHNYFETYYTPSNIAICLSGDLDPDKTIETIEKYFGDWENKEVPAKTFPEQPELTEPIVMETYGQQEEHVFVGFKFDGIGSEDERMLKVTDMILSNSSAGLIDLNLVQGQKILEGYCFPNTLNDHSVHFFYGRPREGQTLEEVKDLLLGEIENLKAGKFEQSDIDAVIKDFKLNKMREMESNWPRVSAMFEAFIADQEWEDVVNNLDDLSTITKEDVVEFANAKYGNNYVISYKHLGEDKNRHKVDKPVITPVTINRDSMSPFMKEFSAIESDRLQPLFLDYDKDINTSELESGVKMSHLTNSINATFQLYYLFDMGSRSDKEMALAIDYLPYLGTSEYSADELKKKFYSLGISFDVYSSSKEIRVSLTGLEESLEEGVELFEHILANVEPNQDVYNGFVSDIIKSRADDKLNKNIILRQGLFNYGKHGADNPFKNIISAEELQAIDVNMLTDKIKSLSSYKHEVFYYGQNDADMVAGVLNSHHNVPTDMTDYPEEMLYAELETEKPLVYFYNYDMVQAEIMLVSKDGNYNPELAAAQYVFNEYFGAGLSSIVFQEIREQKALAYSAWAFYTTPTYANEAHYTRAYVGTQADKMKDALDAMTGLLNDMPEAQQQFDGAVDAAMKKIETDYITKDEIFWDYKRAQKRGLTYDIRKDVYEELKDFTMDDMNAFFDAHIKDRSYTYLVIGNRDNVDADALKALGEYKELSPEEVFNY